MFEALAASAHSGVRTVRDYVGLHDRLLAARDAPTRQEMKAYSVSAAVTRLYAIYESFVETLLSDYLDVIPEFRSFPELPEAMRTEYRVGVSHVLNRIDSPRYRHLPHEDLVRWYHEALSAATPYRFVPEALTRHDENLRLSVLNSMFARIQANDLQGWLSHHPAVSALFPDPTAIWDRLENEVKNFIQLRNDAAHGSLSELVGGDVLLRFCDLISALIESLPAYLYREVVIGKAAKGQTIELGHVTEIFPAHRASILPLLPGRSVSVGIKLHLVSPWTCTEASVESLQLDGAPVEALSSVSAPLEVGLVCSATPRKNVTVYADA
jgi:hypothetical protein